MAGKLGAGVRRGRGRSARRWLMSSIVPSLGTRPTKLWPLPTGRIGVDASATIRAITASFSATAIDRGVARSVPDQLLHSAWSGGAGGGSG